MTVKTQETTMVKRNQQQSSNNKQTNETGRKKRGDHKASIYIYTASVFF